jgi:hypothetical protein
MRMNVAMALLLLAAPLAQAQESKKYDDIVELSPDLYLLMYTSRVETYVGLRLDAIRRANDFAASRGAVVVPVMGRQSALGVALKLYEYQFRVMSREDALAARPVLADAVITVNNTGQCTPNPAVAAAIREVPSPDELRLLAGALPSAGGLTFPSTPAPDATAPDRDTPAPGAVCLPGQICAPSQICLPGYECMPGVPSMPEMATPPPAG